MGESEKALWRILRRDDFGFRIRRQYPVGPYFLDFFCYEAKLCIEVDGEVHALRAERDAVRDAYLQGLGIEVMRLPSLEVFCAPGDHAEVIYNRCCEITGK